MPPLLVNHYLYYSIALLKVLLSISPTLDASSEDFSSMVTWRGHVTPGRPQLAIFTKPKGEHKELG